MLHLDGPADVQKAILPQLTGDIPPGMPGGIEASTIVLGKHQPLCRVWMAGRSSFSMALLNALS